MDFEAVVDELYGGPREEFIRSRDARAAEADDRALAARIKALRKPTLAAWLVNRLAREHPDEVAGLTRLGEELRTAHEELAGQRLRELSQRRRQTVNALTATARDIGRNAGLGVSDTVAGQVHDTLQAALAGGEAAELVVAGRLATALDPSDAQQWLTAGTARPPAERRESSTASGSGTASAKTSRTAADYAEASGTATKPDELRRRRAARERAKQEAAAARTRRDEAAATLAEAEQRARKATEDVNDLRAKLVRAQRYEKLARNAVRAAQLELGIAERESERTERALNRHAPPP